MAVTENTGITDPPYLGTGLVSQYTIPFPFMNATDLTVTRTTGGVDTVLTLGIDYTVAGPWPALTGTLTLTVPLAAGAILTITRNTPYTQPTSFRTQGSFSAAVHEAALDRVVLQTQEMDRRVDLVETALTGAVSAVSVLATGSTTARTLADRAADTVNVKDFGALCDGTTNDAAALTALVTFVTTTPKTVVVSGVCSTASSITIPAGSRVRFEGNGAFTGAGTVTYTAWVPAATAALVGASVVTTTGTIATLGSTTATIATLNATTAAVSGALSGQVTATSTVTARTLAARAVDVWNVRDFGATGDDTTNDTAAIQAALDAAAAATVKKTVVVPPGTYMVSGLLMNSSTYNNVKLISTGGVLKLRPNTGGSVNYPLAAPTVWIGLAVQSCSGGYLDLKWDGNRSGQTATQYIHCIGIAGATDLTIPNLEFTEIKGDGLYIAQSNWAASSTVPERISIGRVTAINSADDGRNAVSIISGKHISIGTMYSYRVGGSYDAGVSWMPGGLDIEPDQGYHTCEDITVGWAHVVTAGTSGIAVLGKAVTNDATRDWNTKRITINGYVQRAGASGQALGPSGFLRCTDVTLNIKSAYATTKGQGILIDYCDDVKGRVEARNVTNGVLVGYSEEARDCTADVHVTDYSLAGLRTANVTRCKFTGKVTFPSLTTAVGVLCHDTGRGGITQTNTTYAVDVPYDSGVGGPTRAFRNEPTQAVSYSGTVVRDCTWPGYTNFAASIDATLPKINVRGMNWASAVPANGPWIAGDVVFNSAPASTAPTFWVCTTSGTPGTWIAGTQYSATYTPAWTAATTNPDIGNGTLSGEYTVKGREVTTRVTLTVGSTSTFGTGRWFFSLPFSANGTYAGSAFAQDLSATARYAPVPTDSVGVDKINLFVGGGSTASVDVTNPFTWATGDQLFITLTYFTA